MVFIGLVYYGFPWVSVRWIFERKCMMVFLELVENSFSRVSIRWFSRVSGRWFF